MRMCVNMIIGLVVMGGGGGMEASKERAGKQRSDARLINVKRTQSCIK